MLMLVVGLVLFLGIHSTRFAGTGLRSAFIDKFGGGPWRGLYTAVSLIGFVLIVWGYARAWPVAPVLYEPPVFVKHIAAFLMLFAMIVFGLYLLPAGRLKPVLKHPMLLAIKIWATAHLLANGDLASILLFGSFLAWAVMDRISLKRRGAPIPQAGPSRNDATGIAVGFALYVLFVWKLHFWLFGVQPLG